MAHVTAAFDDNVQKLIDEWKVPGLGVAVVQGDQIHAKVRSTHVDLEQCLEFVGLRRSSSRRFTLH